MGLHVIPMSKFYFEIPLRPVPKNNSRPILTNRRTGKPFLGKNKALTEYETSALLVLQSQKNLQSVKTISEMVHVSLVFEFAGACRADIDNLIKSALDLLQSAKIIQNDKLVKSLHVKILDHSTRDRTAMTLSNQLD